MASESFDIVLSKQLTPEELAAALADLIRPNLQIDVRSDIADLPEEPGAIWAVTSGTDDPAWPCLVNVLACRDECGLGQYPDLQIAAHLWRRFGIDSLCRTYPFAGELGPHDPYWSLACVGGKWYLASTAGSRLMGPYTDGLQECPGSAPVRFVRSVAIPTLAPENGTAAAPDSAGTGGGLQYITEAAVRDMVNQEQSHSCQAACARQLLIDAGLPVSEAELLGKIGYLEEWGTTAQGTAQVLDDLHPRLGFVGGAVDPDTAAILFQRDPWIASLKTDRGTVHAVIVDKLEGEIVHVRDPWGLSGPGSGTGTRATLKLSDFLEHWLWALNNAVFPNRLK